MQRQTPKINNNFIIQMKNRRRLFKMNQKLLDSSSENHPMLQEGSHLLQSIQNQKLYLKLIGITLAISQESGVSSECLAELETKLLSHKGLDQLHMLNHDPYHQNQEAKKIRPNHQRHLYNVTKKFMHPKEQIFFLKQMQRQVEEVYMKEQLVLALKSYIADKKKTLNTSIIRNQSKSRKKIFKGKAKDNRPIRSINKHSLYGKGLTEVLQKMCGKRDESYQIMGKMVHLKTILGHTFSPESQEEFCPVYNAIFDNTQKLIITGGEEGLIKIWSRDSGLLLSSLKGHKSYINKICVSKCNKFLLSAANDGVRFYDLTTMTALGGMELSNVCDIGQITNLKDPDNFEIMFVDQDRVHIIDKKTICLHRNGKFGGNIVKLELQDCRLYNYKHKITGQGVTMNTFLINPEKYVFMGYTSGHILIFNFNQLDKADIAQNYLESLDEDNPMRNFYAYQKNEFILPVVSVINAHEGEILQLKWNPVFSCLSSGSKKDGSCRIWEWKVEENIKPMLVKELKIPKNKIKRKKKTYACSYICWNCTYSHLICSFEEQVQDEDSQYRGDGEVLVYSTQGFEVTWQMSKSIDLSSVRCIDTHPVYQNIALICDSFGKLLIVDIYESFIINMFEERGYHIGHPTFCLVPSECRFSQDGYKFLVATQYGNLSIYGYDIKDFYDVNPVQQFFETDYQKFEINPESYKPVLSLENDIDINQLPKGELCNLRQQPHLYHLYNLGEDAEARQYNYEKYRILPHQILNKVSQFVFNSQPENLMKLNHINSYLIPQEVLIRFSQCLREYERSMEVYRQNIEELQNKRFAIMYEEREEKSLKVKQYLQQKIKKLKELNNEMSSRHDNNSLMNSKSNAHGMAYETDIQTRNIKKRRGRGRQLRSLNPHSNHLNINNSDQQDFEGFREDEQEYHGSSQLQEENYEQDIEDNFDQYNEKQSDSPFHNRRNMHSNRFNNRRRSQRNVSRRNYEVYEIEEDNDEGQRVTTGLRRLRKPINQEIDDLLKIDSEHIRKRFQRQEEFLDKPERRRYPSKRSSMIEHLNDDMNQNQTEICCLCQTLQVSSSCSKCQTKKYCELCQPYRLKKHSLTPGYGLSGYTNANYSCFSCYFKYNTREQCHDNISHQKYILNSRETNWLDKASPSQNLSSKFLFVPQVDDQIAFFTQGYEQFVIEKIDTLNNKILNMQIHGIQENFELLPHDTKQGGILKKVHKCIVKQIKHVFPLCQNTSNLYFSGNRRARDDKNKRMSSSNSNQDILMFIRLQMVPLEGDDQNQYEFWVFFIPGYEYILKYEIYENIMESNAYSKIQLFNIAEMKGEEVQFMEVKPSNPHLYPDSIWKNVIVHRGENKNLRKSKEENQNIAVNIWNIKGFVDQSAFEYKSTLTEETKQKYIQQIQSIAQNEPDAWAIFGYFVDISQFSTYYHFVEVGMCLKLIMDRLTNNYYKSLDSLICDMRHLIHNSITFNGQDNYITTMCQNIVNEIIFSKHFEDQGRNEFETTQKKNNRNRNKQSSNESEMMVKNSNNEPKGSRKMPNTQRRRVSRFRAQDQSDDNYSNHESSKSESDSDNGQNNRNRLRLRNRKNEKNNYTTNGYQQSQKFKIHKGRHIMMSDSQDHDDNSKSKRNRKKKLCQISDDEADYGGSLRNNNGREARSSHRNVRQKSRDETTMRVTRSRTKN